MTDRARQIQREHNRVLPPAAIRRPGGILTVAGVMFPMREHRVTIKEVRAYLEARDGTPHRTAFDLYGSTRRRPLEERPSS